MYLLGTLIKWLLGVPLVGGFILLALSNTQAIRLDIWPLDLEIWIRGHVLLLIIFALGFLCGVFLHILRPQPPKKAKRKNSGSPRLWPRLGRTKAASSAHTDLTSLNAHALQPPLTPPRNF